MFIEDALLLAACFFFLAYLVLGFMGTAWELKIIPKLSAASFIIAILCFIGFAISCCISGIL